MDVTQAKTFLAIIDGGSFSTAAARLHVTQSTVSARVKTLEDQLGKPLFRRSRGGCELTHAGNQFQRFARSMVRVWEDAKVQVALPEGFTEVLVIGGQYSLWKGLLLSWVTAFRSQYPHIALRGEVGMPDELMREMSDGILDIAVLYNPRVKAGTSIEKLLDDQLIMVTAAPNTALEANYVFIDWGEGFRAFHAERFPHLQTGGMVLDIGSLAADLIIRQGGSAYLPERIAKPHLEAGQLHKVANAPAFEYPAYVTYAQETADSEAMIDALASLRQAASKSL